MSSMLKVGHLAIVGGGFSGTLLAINLLRYGSMRVSLIERQPARLGKGVAFGSAQPDHILNVRAGNMSAFPDQPRHFVEWLERQDSGSDASFATRRAYGRYLTMLLEQARGDAGDRFEVIADQAVDLLATPTGHAVRLASGGSIVADMVVLAPGNLPPHDLPPVRHLSPPRYIAEPWPADIAADLGPDDSVLLLGSGLTAIDCAQTLDSAGFRGRIIALSRRGLIPHSHAPGTPFIAVKDRPGGGCAALLGKVRARADAIGWRNAVDELRPFTQDIWRASSQAERTRFLRHLRPWWDVHRHRIAPQVADRIGAMVAEGRLSIFAGKIVEAVEADGRIDVRWRARGADETRQVQVTRIVNCTGPLADLGRTTDPLLRALADRGLVRPDGLSIGIDVDQEGRAIGRDGSAQDRLMVVGPMTRGAHWEIVAVPDIRRQTWDLARTLTGSHWADVEGL